MTRAVLHRNAAQALLAAWFAVFAATQAAAFELRQVQDSVVRVLTDKSSGSGFLVANKVVATNYHVVDGAKEVSVAFLRQDGDKKVPVIIKTRVIIAIKDKDLALLEAESNLAGSPLRLGAYEPEQLSLAVAIGFPAIADRAMKVEGPQLLVPTVTKGEVGRVLLVQGHWRMVQHSATFHGGNSGGPLFDDCNNVVAVNTFTVTGEVSKEGRVDTPQGIFYSVHTSELIGIMQNQKIVPTIATGCAPSLMAKLVGRPENVLIIFMAMLLLASAGIFFAFRTGWAMANLPRAISEPLSRLSQRARHRQAPARALPEESRATAGALSLKSRGAEPSLDLDMRQVEKGITIGRSSSCDAVVGHATVSSRHANLQLDRSGELILTDLDSTNGTFVNGSKITEKRLRNGDKVRFGSADFEVQLGEQGAAGPAPRKNGEQQTWSLSGFDSTGQRFKFKLVPDKDEEGRPKATMWRIGRDPQRCDFAIDDGAISRRHAAVKYDPDRGMGIRDDGSSNGTFVDGEPIGTEYVYPAKPRELKLGSITVKLSHFSD